MESNQIHVKQSVERDLMLKTGEMEKHICEMLDQNRKAIRFSLMEAAEQITPYDVEDMKRVLESQKEMTNNITMQNSQLVMENSELRMHLSFMPVEYRDYVKNMQAITKSIAISAELPR
jgi:regulator of replication initiation timing